MALSSQSIKNLKGGISQQPDILRFPNQGAQQINGWSSETKGLQKRPPTVFIKRLDAKQAFGINPLIHPINRDASEQYFLVFTKNTVRVFDLAGTEYPVSGVDSYLKAPKPRDDLRLLTVADYTFIVNRNVKVEMGSTLTHASYGDLNARAIVSCRGGQYGRVLRIKVNNVTVVTYTLPDGLASDNTELSKEVAAMDAQAIIKELVSRINDGHVPAGSPPGTPPEGGTAVHGVTATAGKTYLTLTKDGGITSVETQDGYADQLISGFVYQVQTTAKLPIAAPNGYLVEITGEASRTGDNYWVRYDANAGVWKETVKPGIIAGLDSATMPRALVRKADGSFELQRLPWTGRTVGDDETNPMPSMVDQTINDVFFFRNRLGFLAGENLLMSRTGKYFQFFTSSVAATNDDDLIDVAVSHNRISILKYAVPFSEQLLLWSDQAQFVLTSQGALTAKTAQLDLTTEFDVMESARPFGLGRGVYFSAPRAKFSSVKRYYAVADVSNVKNAEDITGHVPTYIPNKVFSIHGSGTENFVTALSDGDLSKLFVYKFLYQDEVLAQQSWSHWEYGNARVMVSYCIGSTLYLILDRAEGLTLEKADFTPDTIDMPEEPYRCYVDGKITTSAVDYDEDLDESSIHVTAIYGGVPEGDMWAIDSRGVATRYTKGERVGGRIRFYGDRRGETFVIGRAFKFTYEFSKFLIKVQADDGTVSTEDSGRLQLRKVWVNYEQSGLFTVDVDNGSNKFSYLMGSSELGNITLGQLSQGTGQSRFSVTGNAWRQTVTAWSDSPQPLNIIGCGFEGNYVRRSNGI